MLLVLIVVAILVNPLSAQAAIYVYTCGTNDDVATVEWGDHFQKAFFGMLTLADYPRDMEIWVDPLDKPCPRIEYGCRADPKTGHIFCSEQSLARLLHAIAWVAVTRVNDPNKETPGSTPISDGPVLSMQAALEIVDSYSRTDAEARLERFTRKWALDDQLKEIVQLIKVAFVAPDSTMALSKGLSSVNGERVHRAYTIYNAAAIELIAFLMGHEMNHVMDECHLTTPSSVEKSGLFQRLINMQATGKGVFNKKELVMDEIVAERCGLRVVEKIDSIFTATIKGYSDKELSDEENKEMKALQGLDLSEARRVAIDAVAWLLETSLGGRTNWIPSIEEGKKDYTGILKDLNFVRGPNGELAVETTIAPPPPDDYLYPALRLALFATLLNNLEPRNKHVIALCGPTAKAFVEMAMRSSVYCCDRTSPQGRMSDLFHHIVPKGVVNGWNTGDWSWKNSDKAKTIKEEYAKRNTVKNEEEIRLAVRLKDAIYQCEERFSY